MSAYSVGYFIGYYGTALLILSFYALAIAIALKLINKLGLAISRLLKPRLRATVVVEETRLLGGFSNKALSDCQGVFLPKGQGNPSTIEATVVTSGKSISDEMGVPVSFQRGYYQSNFGPQMRALPAGEGKATSVASTLIAEGEVPKPLFDGGKYRLKM